MYFYVIGLRSLQMVLESRLSSTISRYHTYEPSVPTYGFFYLANLETKHLLEVCRLADEKQIESPASAEICHNDGVYRH